MGFKLKGLATLSVGPLQLYCIIMSVAVFVLYRQAHHYCNTKPYQVQPTILQRRRPFRKHHLPRGGQQSLGAAQPHVDEIRNPKLKNDLP